MLKNIIRRYACCRKKIAQCFPGFEKQEGLLRAGSRPPYPSSRVENFQDVIPRSHFCARPTPILCGLETRGWKTGSWNHTAFSTGLFFNFVSHTSQSTPVRSIIRRGQYGC